MNGTLRIVTGIAAASWCLACATERSPLVESVKAEYQDTAADPVVDQHASVELYEAQQTVSRLERAWERDQDRDEVEHLASLARHQLEIARARGDTGAFQKQLAELGEQRDQLQLQARSLEATLAQDRAARAEAQAAEAQARADTATEIARTRGEELADVAARARELESQVSDLKTRQESRGLVVTLNDVLFEFDRSDLKRGATRTLERLAEFVNEYPDRNILIEGHTDSIGSDAYNQRLSKERAESVGSFLETRDVDPSRIQTRGLGESAPIASNNTEAGRQQNRRVELILRNPSAR